MNSEEMFNWPDGDVILRAAHGSDSRDFRVHKLFLSFASPVFKDMFDIPQPSSATSNNIPIIYIVDPPRAVDLILRFIYPSSPPVVDDLTIISEALSLADKYDIKVARSRLRPSLTEFAKTEPMRIYAIACRFGFEEEMKIASSHTTSIHLPGLVQLPDEFKFIPATQYHRLILLHAKYRNEIEAIASSAQQTPRSRGSSRGSFFGELGAAIDEITEITHRQPVLDIVRKGTPLNYESLALALKTDHGLDAETSGIGKIFRSILDKASALNLTV